MKVKICGLTKVSEAEYLNEAGSDYAGFVFYGPSKRNVTKEKAQEIMRALNPEILKVAVMVSPEASFVREIEALGFDILQIHKELKTEVLEVATKPVWFAVNVSDEAELDAKENWLESLPKELKDKVTAFVVDAPEFGSGKTFNWRKSKRLLKAGAQSPPKRMFVLAGGLNTENVSEGIKLFHPDVVDVSSGVEGPDGKDREKVISFVKNAKENEA